MNDKRKILADALGTGWVLDFDEDYVYFEQWVEDDEEHRYLAFRKTYEISDDNVVTFGKEKERVVTTTEFQAVGSTEVTEKSIKGFINNALDKYFGGSKKGDINVIKQFGDDGEMVCIEPLYTAPLQADGDGDMMNAETIEGMVNSINKANKDGRLQNGLFHKHRTRTWYLDKAWVNPTTCVIGDTVVPEGQPIAKTIFTNKAAFELRKKGEIAGLSIGARAKAFVSVSKSCKELTALQSTPRAKRQIIGTHFDWEYPELTYTSRAQGGASHMQNTVLNIDKVKKATKKDLLGEEEDILEEIGEEFVSLEKHLGVDNDQPPSSSSGGKVGEETKVYKGTQNIMTGNTVTRQEFEELQKALNVSRAENTLMSYGFDVDLNKSLATAIASLESEDAKAVTDAFDALIVRGEEAVNKAKAAKPKAENELQKALEEETGEGGEPEQKEVEKSLIDRIMAVQDAEGGTK